MLYLFEISNTMTIQRQRTAHAPGARQANSPPLRLPFITPPPHPHTHIHTYVHTYITDITLFGNPTTTSTARKEQRAGVEPPTNHLQKQGWLGVRVVQGQGRENRLPGMCGDPITPVGAASSPGCRREDSAVART